MLDLTVALLALAMLAMVGTGAAIAIREIRARVRKIIERATLMEEENIALYEEIFSLTRERDEAQKSLEMVLARCKGETDLEGVSVEIGRGGVTHHFKEKAV